MESPQRVSRIYHREPATASSIGRLAAYPSNHCGANDSPPSLTKSLDERVLFLDERVGECSLAVQIVRDGALNAERWQKYIDSLQDAKRHLRSTHVSLFTRS